MDTLCWTGGWAEKKGAAKRQCKERGIATLFFVTKRQRLVCCRNFESIQISEFGERSAATIDELSDKGLVGLSQKERKRGGGKIQFSSKNGSRPSQIRLLWLACGTERGDEIFRTQLTASCHSLSPHKERECVCACVCDISRSYVSSV